MKASSRKVICWRFTVFTPPDSINGIKTTTNSIIAIKALKAIIRYLNFKENTPIIRIGNVLMYSIQAEKAPLDRIIEESAFYVNVCKAYDGGTND